MPSITDWIKEYYHLTRARIIMYVHRNPLAYLQPQPTPGQPTIVMISGINSHWGSMQPLASFLYNKGYSVIGADDSKRNMGTIAEGAKYIAQLISELKLETVVIIGHSKGGLVGKQLLVFHNQEKRIRGLIAITTPFHGASLASIVPLPAYKELLPASNAIKLLDQHSEVNKDIITISAAWDNMVKPYEGTHLEGARENISLPTRGHSTTSFHPLAWNTILKAITTLSS